MTENKVQKQGQQGQTAALQLIRKDIVDVVSNKINEYVNNNMLNLPADYSPDNAMKAAWLVLQSITDKTGKPALLTCTHDSIANALLDMVVQGLNPVKEQCYFIVHGNKLTLRRSYFGTAAVAARVLKLRNIFAAVVYEGDGFEYEIRADKMVVTKHQQKLGNINPDKMVAVYCLLQYNDGRPDYTEIMTMAQVKKAWAKSATDTGKAGNPQKEFPDQMAKRTVINRACKLAINMTTDSSILTDSFKRTTYEEVDPAEQAELLDAEVAQLGNAELLDFPEEPAGQAQQEEPAGNGQQQAIGDNMVDEEDML